MRFSGKINDENIDEEIERNLSTLKRHVNDLLNEETGKVQLTFDKDKSGLYFILSTGIHQEVDEKMEKIDKLIELLGVDNKEYKKLLIDDVLEKLEIKEKEKRKEMIKKMSLKDFLNVDIEKMKENNKKRELEELEPIPEAIKEEIKLKKAIEKRREEYSKEKWEKKHATELDILKEIYELRKNTDICKDNIDELKPKLIESGNLLKQLKQCNPHFYGYFCALIEATKDKLDYKEINFEEMFLEVDEEIKEIKERQKQEKRKKAKKLTDQEKKQLIKEEMEKGIQMVINEELDDIDDDEKVEKVLEEFDNKRLDEIKLQDAIKEKELMEQYKTETGKDALTLRKTIRKSYLKWKTE